MVAEARSYRRLHALLRREGWRVNHRAVHRINVEEGLQVKKMQAQARRPGRAAAHAGAAGDAEVLVEQSAV